MEDKQGFFQKLGQNDMARKIILVAGIAGISLLLLSSFLGDGQKQSEPASVSSQTDLLLNAQAYADTLEAELTQMIRSIQGAGEPHVLVTLEEGSQQIYAVQQKRSTQAAESGTSAEDTEENYLIVQDADGTEHALAVTQRPPKVQGVVVTCPGAADPHVQQAVLEAVSTAAGVSSARVCVVPSG